MLLATFFLSAGLAGPLPQAGPSPPEPVQVVTSLTTYGAIAREIVGDRGTVTSIAEGNEDPHFVQPKPSFISLLRDADLFVTTGLDLELWVPVLLDRAGNRQVSEGGPGYVTAYTGIELLDVPAVVDRSQGDLHAAGNPHIHTDPVNAIIIARNILAGLQRISPGNARYFAAREADFERRILEATVGRELVEMLTPSATFDLLRKDAFLDFIADRAFQGAPLSELLGGWMKQAEPFRGKEMACYHKEWVYFTERYRISCMTFIEAKPGIPPTPRHVQEVITLMRQRNVPVLFASNYFSHDQIEQVAEKTGATAIIVPENTDGAPGIKTYFDLMDLWVTRLAEAYR